MVFPFWKRERLRKIAILWGRFLKSTRQKHSTFSTGEFVMPRKEASRNLWSQFSVAIYNKHLYYIYITTNPERTVLYTGVTNNLSQRLIEHWINRGDSKTFAGRYYCYNLIYFEDFQYVYKAIAREKEIKGWRREEKLELINTKNPDWFFLNAKVCGDWPPKRTSMRY